ncbi:hypothetical protein DL766_007105 [Monosporascus sp. MC13-8B]|uniref:Uncharacterized protein n=1 Tax=Monosporascus cannonballus TaxID=155416 RepID=A0ABY0HAH0_9PEZI|nr:hypothetical protein DL762_003960 [Monosporascus cannonballus]RYO94806.1 hypothetical protein DL763_003910 [Monosporascus cannonballus]RYP25300.1 hypothetical protein DL766_007105 [Monosporascus sp. MC13-8B]
MCKYYAHAFSCKHMSFTFARYCNPASLIQTPCNKKQIWHTISLDEACDECNLWFPEQYPPPAAAAAAATGKSKRL